MNVERLNPPGLPPSAGQTQVVVSESARTAYVSGQVAMNADGEVVGDGDFAAQVRCVVANLLAARGALGTAQFTKLTIYVVNLDAAAHGPALGAHLDLGALGNPAATLISVAGLARPEFLIEIEAVLAVD